MLNDSLNFLKDHWLICSLGLIPLTEIILRLIPTKKSGSLINFTGRMLGKAALLTIGLSQKLPENRK